MPKRALASEGSDFTLWSTTFAVCPNHRHVEEDSLREARTSTARKLQKVGRLSRLWKFLERAQQTEAEVDTIHLE
jgi:hypothetical protein